MNAENTQKATRGGTVAVLIARVLVPLWLLIGAVLKLVDLSPTHLPAAIIKWVGYIHLDLMFVLRLTIAVELIVVIVMVVLPTLARWVGIAMLALFVPVLIGDIALGASSCGCFGAVQMSPWITLVTDVTFLAGLIFLGRREPRLAMTATLPTWRVLIAGALSVASVMAAFGLPSPSVPTPGGGDESVEGLSTALPAEGFYLPQYDEWLGRSFAELEVATWIDELPDDIASGSQYVFFYRKDCEHCHELMEMFFAGELLVPTTAVAVPERDGFPTENVQAFPCSGCRVAELPQGVDWFLQTPVLVRLYDGIVECVAEEDPAAPQCVQY
jgi:hypothetical protein